MSLEHYCRDRRAVILNSSATAYDAVRALESNHIGAIVVQDEGRLTGIVTDRDLARRVIGFELEPTQTALGDVMTPEPTSIALDETEETAAKLMRARHVRRLPIVSGERALGIITFDDLVMSRSVAPELLAEIVEAQLSEPAESKPAGVTHPMRAAVTDPEARHAARVERTLNAFKARIRNKLGMQDGEQALAAFEVVAAGLVRRLNAREAGDFIAQLPAAVKEKLLDLPAGPDAAITRERIEEDMAERLHVERSEAAELVERVGAALGDFVSHGELEHVKSQLPAEMKGILSAA